MKTLTFAALAASLLAGGAMAQGTGPRPDQLEFRGLYKELVETNTTLSVGSCTLAAERMAARLKAAGIKDDQITLFSVPEKPREGGLVVLYPGTSKTLKPMLMLAHIDVVEANRADWERDPFTLLEENGYFYARGAYDDKAQAAIYTDALIRFAKTGYKPKRTIKLALTCGEETGGAFNGAEWLAANRRELIDAEFAINEGGGGRGDGQGKLLVQTVQVGEKAYQDYTLTVTNPGGHSSTPVRDNAIYAMSEAVLKVRDHTFPLQFNDTTRSYFAKAAPLFPGETGQAMAALAANPTDKAAEAIVSRDKSMNSMLRTTCVATMVDGGHARNALPQRVTANVNCRIFPGNSSDQVQAALEAVIGNPLIKIEQTVRNRPIAKQPPLDPRIIGPMERVAARHFPGVPVVPTMSTGATDGLFLSAVGIPVYGIPGLWRDPDGNGTHGLNERIGVRSLYEGRDYIFDLIKGLAG
ncbi:MULTISPECIES: M20/M25/M40 family metallo-hydrolase [unclassified Novosphingobium]|uniref:M20/M25/M40 family metallo-hydrolase n=1 Tax=unclassified Novosphingobium TaxID=2644732 RepID=UPI0025F3779A|nr:MULTISPECIES: M20/M25/M40 family metallo-hydrolase [unclassified Novosphingobium]HQV03277.1 M20/M25/M40 family metallo-hydrolase [Novosphingobium sp.]